jgi:hypothetical protein
MLPVMKTPVRDKPDKRPIQIALGGEKGCEKSLKYKEIAKNVPQGLKPC